MSRLRCLAGHRSSKRGRLSWLSVARRLAPGRPSVSYRAVAIAALATVWAGALTIVHYSFTVGTHIQFAFVQHNYRSKKVLVFSIRLYGRISPGCSCLNCGGYSLFQILILSATDLSFLVCSQWMNRIRRY